MSLGLFTAAWTTLDQSASALTNGTLSLLGKLNANGICLGSRRIFTQTEPNSRKTSVTATSRASSVSD